MKLKNLIFFLFIILSSTGCYEDTNTSNLEIKKDKHNFFPLQVGNYWELYPYAQSYDATILKMEITDIKSFEGVKYYLMIRKSEWTDSVSTDSLHVTTDSAYYRTDENGFVYQRLKSGEIINPYRLNAKDGDAWQLSDTFTEDDMSVDYISDPVEIQNKQLKSLRVFAFDRKNWEDEEFYHTLAPGIGIVSIRGWGIRQDLKKAIIDGKEQNF